MLRPKAVRHVAAAAAGAGRSRCPARQARALSSTAARSRPPPPRNHKAKDGTVDEPSSSSSSSSSSASTATATATPPPSTLYGYFPLTLPAGAPPAGPFAVDVPALRREFLCLQAAAHPDKQPPARKAAAEAASAAINHAYRTLADPLLRAQYLLALRGVDVAADESLRLDDSPAGGAGDGDLLMLVLDAHEVIEAAEAPRHLEPLRGENDDRIRRCDDALARAFAADDVDAAKREAVRLRYWVNIRNAIHEWEEGKPPVLQH
ncbi:putative chaperone [Hirsutella rhossiliensis]|uniref:Chaperone n=1 Tax=Hirsutella rhossiliensis TaxID=111463 RepID=A0A9P8SLA3_9HYPO|nr:putative chaperone [Hirsutella rhossiliensis]KAH0967263.1 putative chaperone [Hirsutella rhossiliensis]